MPTMQGPVAGLILFAAAFVMLGHVTGVPPRAPSAPGPSFPPAAVETAPVLVTQIRPRHPAPMQSERQALAAALASHANPHGIQVGFYLDLIRSMEKAGVEAETARHAAVLIAGNPKLDTIAAMTIAGCVPAYAAATKRPFDEAVAELAGYIEQPDRTVGAEPAGLGLVRPETGRRIREKLDGGNRTAAERLVEQALLARFNPTLGAKILVPM